MGAAPATDNADDKDEEGDTSTSFFFFRVVRFAFFVPLKNADSQVIAQH